MAISIDALHRLTPSALERLRTMIRDDDDELDNLLFAYTQYIKSIGDPTNAEIDDVIRLTHQMNQIELWRRVDPLDYLKRLGHHFDPIIKQTLMDLFAITPKDFADFGHRSKHTWHRVGRIEQLLQPIADVEVAEVALSGQPIFKGTMGSATANSGVVKVIRKGYALIHPDDGSDDFLLDPSVATIVGISEVNVGAKVKFRSYTNEPSRRSIVLDSIRLLNDEETGVKGE